MDVGVVLLLIFLAVLVYVVAKSQRGPAFQPIGDSFRSVQEVSDALRRAGLESCNLIVGIDFTASNTNHQESFGGRPLHYIDKAGKELNPYQQVLTVIGSALEKFDEDGLVPAYGFGDITTRDANVFSLKERQSPCHGLGEILSCYERVVKSVNMSGPTSIKPIIDRAIGIIEQTHLYHILVIISDGQVTDEDEAANAIVRASSFPLSIVMVGVGDGPWDMMKEFDDGLPRRKFDNFQFVNFNEVSARSLALGKGFDSEFALAALMEIPEQFRAIKRLGLLRRMP